MKNKSKGFTLIELLAVVIILGILMTVGGVAITRIVENTRKDTFINTAQEYAEAVRTLWLADDFTVGTNNMMPSDVPYGNYYVLIDTSNSNNELLLEKGGKSPWGDRNLKGYVRVNVTENEKGNLVPKFFVALSDGIHGIYDNVSKIITSDKLTRKHVISDLGTYVSPIKENAKEAIENPNGGNITTANLANDVNTDEKLVKVISGTGFDLGDEIALRSEHFYVLASDPSTVTLFAKYNLFVGIESDGKNSITKEYKDEATGIQDETMKGQNLGGMPYKGTTPFSDDKHHGKEASDYKGSLVELYNNNYHDFMENIGVKCKVRTIMNNELRALGCGNGLTCYGAPEWIYSTSYWAGPKFNFNSIYGVVNDSSASYYAHQNYWGQIYGVRPVIVIDRELYTK